MIMHSADSNSLSALFEWLKQSTLTREIAPSVIHSVEIMIVNYLLPNTIETMKNQKFRADMLYNQSIDVDDLFKKI